MEFSGTGEVSCCTSDTDGTIIWGDLNVDSLKDVWQIVGEERFDENGNPGNKNYKQKGTVFA